MLQRYIVRVNRKNSERNNFFSLSCLEGRPSDMELQESLRGTTTLRETQHSDQRK